MKTLKWLLVLSFLCFDIYAQTPTGTWTKVTPPTTFPPGFPGVVQERSWYGTIAYRPSTNGILFYDGYVHTAGGYPSGIYANAMAEWNLAANTIAVSNITDTNPTKRHTYEVFTYVPPQDAVYIMKGAFNGCGDFGMWKYSFSTNTWSEIVTTLPPTYGCEGHQMYWAATNKLVYIPSDGNRVYEFNFSTNIWTLVFTSGTVVNLYNAHSLWDSKRDRWVFITVNATLISYDPVAHVFTTLPVSGSAPTPRGEAGITYISTDDLYMIAGGTTAHTDTWIYNPTTTVWKQITSATIPSGHTYLFYEPNADRIYAHLAGVSGQPRIFYRMDNFNSGGTAPPNTNNFITIHNTSGSAISNRPVSIARPFKEGELNYAQAVVGTTPVLTQCDVKNRWSDGSLKFAIVSFVVPSIASGGNVEVAFQNQATGNNTGFLDQTGMLAAGYNFGGTVTMTGAATRTANARTMLNGGNWRYWLQGPIVTAVIIEDRTTSRTYDLDFGDGSKALHPIFEAWFYPQGNRVNLGFAMENCWASNTQLNSMRDLTYSAVLASGNTGPTTEWTNASFNHIGRTRWHKAFWLGTDPPAIRVDHKLSYLVTTKAIPNYDTSIAPQASLETNRFTAFEADNNSFGDDGLYSSTIDGTGTADWIGLHPTWETLWLYSMSDNGWAMLTGNADHAGRIPMFFREADTQAGTGNWFDQQYTQQTNLASAGTPSGTGTVATFGRPISINARRTVGLNSLSGVGEDDVVTGTITSDGYPAINTSHLPDVAYMAYLFTGRYYYLELLQMEAAYCIGNKDAAWGSQFARPGDVGLINHSNVRGDAWGVKLAVHASFISPDGTPEQAYFFEKLHDNVSMFEGLMNLTLSYPAKQQQWNWGRNMRALLVLEPAGGVSPLGQWQDQGSGFIQAPLLIDGTLNGATAQWEENFLVSVLGRARDLEVSTTDNILRFMAKLRFRINLTTVPGVTLSTFIEAARAPTLSNSNVWMQTMTEWVSHFDTTIEPYIGRRTNYDPDHSYAFIALAADSFLFPYTVDGFSGQASWQVNKTTTPNQQHFVGGHTNASPKWAIVPYGTAILSPPLPPENLIKVP